MKPSVNLIYLCRKNTILSILVFELKTGKLVFLLKAVTLSTLIIHFMCYLRFFFVVLLLSLGALYIYNLQLNSSMIHNKFTSYTVHM
jgi:hypothetical protein